MRICVATNNSDKHREIAQLLAQANIEVLSQSAFGVPEVEERGLSFIENAIIKARHAAQYTELPCVGDDSGLCVDALGGAPGIYSARYAGMGASSKDNMNKLIGALKTVPESDRAARFFCAMAFVRHANDPTPLIFQASWEGQLLSEPKGANGFGYDPLFYLPELGRTVGELAFVEKNKISHRAKALQKLINHLSIQLGF